MGTSTRALTVRQAVILMLEHGQDGSQGLILNKRTEHRMKEVLGAEMLCPEFGDNALYLVRWAGCVAGVASPVFKAGLFGVYISQATAMCTLGQRAMYKP